jgi:pyruvate/2-oxoglutarate dehydrogenase complex dihydrolipoamide dehydrogenase (E3) component
MDSDEAAHIDRPLRSLIVVGEVLAASLRERGVQIIDNAGHVTASRTESGIEAKLATGESLSAEKVIFATGRVGNTEGLGLEVAGVTLDDRGRVAGTGQARLRVRVARAARRAHRR